MALILVRHTRLHHSEGLCYGNSEVPLADTFEVESDLVLKKIPAPTRIFSSPSERCHALARKLAARYPQARLSLDPRLAEMSFGRWQGLDWFEVPRHEVDLWVADFFHSRAHGGESVAMLEARVHQFLADAAPRQPQDVVVAVTHKGVIRAALASMDHPEGWRYDCDYGDFVEWKARL